MSTAKTWFRIGFWVVFLTAAAIAGYMFYMRGIPQQVKRDLRLMQHPNARVASEAWLRLRELYYTKWEAYEIILDHARDPQPINFLVERTAEPMGETSRSFFSANNRPIFYKTDQVYCRTVGDAILAFAYDERKWKLDYDGGWDDWWQANKGYYGRP